ncbi:hypothetical protein HZ326_12070 [Fusarium oxysporum f. sp. albedinis]|nr:hypothetical protein HZ326_12070 [Fusarium oxysporum f. sp. albedinis]
MSTPLIAGRPERDHLLVHWPSETPDLLEIRSKSHVVRLGRGDWLAAWLWSISLFLPSKWWKSRNSNNGLE